MGKSPQQIIDEFTQSDFFRFQWRILKYMCEMSDKYGSFLETELFFRTDLKAYLDEHYGEEYLHGKEGTLYKLLMDKVMNYLLNRHAVEVSKSYPYGESEMKIYKITQKLKNKCKEFKYEMGDHKLLDELLPHDE
jgi:hypothetical protein